MNHSRLLIILILTVFAISIIPFYEPVYAIDDVHVLRVGDQGYNYVGEGDYIDLDYRCAKDTYEKYYIVRPKNTGLDFGDKSYEKISGFGAYDTQEACAVDCGQLSVTSETCTEPLMMLTAVYWNNNEEIPIEDGQSVGKIGTIKIKSQNDNQNSLKLSNSYFTHLIKWKIDGQTYERECVNENYCESDEIFVESGTVQYWSQIGIVLQGSGLTTYVRIPETGEYSFTAGNNGNIAIASENFDEINQIDNDDATDYLETDQTSGAEATYCSNIVDETERQACESETESTDTQSVCYKTNMEIEGMKNINEEMNVPAGTVLKFIKFTTFNDYFYLFAFMLEDGTSFYMNLVQVSQLQNQEIAECSNYVFGKQTSNEEDSYVSNALYIVNECIDDSCKCCLSGEEAENTEGYCNGKMEGDPCVYSDSGTGYCSPGGCENNDYAQVSYTSSGQRKFTIPYTDSKGERWEFDFYFDSSQYTTIYRCLNYCVPELKSTMTEVFGDEEIRQFTTRRFERACALYACKELNTDECESGGVDCDCCDVNGDTVRGSCTYKLPYKGCGTKSSSTGLYDGMCVLGVCEGI